MKEYNRNDRNRIPINPGIYFLFENEVLVYIGKAKNLRHRINQHHNQNFYQSGNANKLRIDFAFHKITRIVIYEIPYYLTLSLEYILIQHFRPSLNYHTKKFHPIDKEMSLINKKVVKDWFENQKE